MLKLADSDLKRLDAAIDAIRARTSVRFDLQVVHVADRYALYPIAYGAFAALILGGGFAVFDPAFPARTAFVLETVLFVVLSLAFEWLPLKLMLVPRRQKNLRAQQMAHRAFAARILAARERRSGMLVFVALGERHVELVTDDALDRHIGQPVWNAIVKDLTAAAARGDLANGLVAAVEACGKALAQQFPA
ncbi:MAG TPA: TPM domain-containing protein [Rhizomicrobium sp.]|nr:TPM domain-containing protein [Rhizomicrobium sp.]